MWGRGRERRRRRRRRRKRKGRKGGTEGGREGGREGKMLRIPIKRVRHNLTKRELNKICWKHTHIGKTAWG